MLQCFGASAGKDSSSVPANQSPFPCRAVPCLEGTCPRRRLHCRWHCQLMVEEEKEEEENEKKKLSCLFGAAFDNSCVVVCVLSMNESVRKIWRRQWRQYLIVCVCFTLHLPLPLFPAFPNFYCCCNFATAASSFDEMCTGEICVYFCCFRLLGLLLLLAHLHRTLHTHTIDDAMICADFSRRNWHATASPAASAELTAASAAHQIVALHSAL